MSAILLLVVLMLPGRDEAIVYRLPAESLAACFAMAPRLLEAAQAEIKDGGTVSAGCAVTVAPTLAH